MSDKSRKEIHAVGYTVDFTPGPHRFVAVEGVGECREPFARLVQALEREHIDAVVAEKAAYLFVDTASLWMEKFIAIAKRRRVGVADADSGREYDLNVPRDEAAFRALRQPHPE